MHKQNAASLLVVLRKPNSSKWQEYAEDLLLFDHVLHILPCDLVGSRSEASLGQLLCKVYIVDGLKEIAIISDRGTTRQLTALLDTLLPLLKSDGALSVAGFEVSASAFGRMIHSCEQVTLLACQMRGQWQKAITPAAKCRDLSIKLCSGSTPKRFSLGQSAWPALRSILIWENSDLPALSPRSHLWLSHPASIECDSELTKSLVRSLWSPGISDLHISGSQDLSWVAELPPSKALKSVWFGGSSVSEDVFR